MGEITEYWAFWMILGGIIGGVVAYQFGLVSGYNNCWNSSEEIK